MNIVNDDKAINEVISTTEVKKESLLSVGVSRTKAVVGIRLWARWELLIFQDSSL